MQKQIAIPRYIWDSLEAAIQAESRRLVRDIAGSLGKPELELWNQVKDKKVSAYFVDLQDPTNEEFKCEAFDLEALVQRKCCRPVIFGTKACAAHTHTQHLKPDTTLPVYKAIKYEDSEGNFQKAYLKDRDVLHPDTLEKIGEWDSSIKKLLLFEKDSTSEA
jgi:hypothetical protein